jgi:hypothetical protein
MSNAQPTAIRGICFIWTIAESDAPTIKLHLAAAHSMQLPYSTEDCIDAAIEECSSVDSANLNGSCGVSEEVGEKEEIGKAEIGK